ncbi:MAG TPA: aminopeptidase P family N-terminal domain-containing protein, partial [Thermoleophilaceae bacterium]|nr:aminopeptidase P family N-terminal domain-containing protein [Thermoleophilaceae bacterium]
MSVSDRAERPAPRDYELDTSFIERPHHTDPRRLYSQTSTDWQQRVDHDRLRRDRLARARAAMDDHDLGGLIMFVGENIRYVTGTFQGNWKHNIFIRYAVLPRDGDPVLFETVGSDFECAKLDAPWLDGNIRPAFTWRWAEGAEPMMVGRMADSVVEVLRDAGVENERIGIDTADMSAMQAFQERGLNLANAWPAMSQARRVKTPDEIELLKISSSLG